MFVVLPPSPPASPLRPEQELVARRLLSRLLQPSKEERRREDRDARRKRENQDLGRRRDDQDSSPSIVYPQVSQQVRG